MEHDTNDATVKAMMRQQTELWDAAFAEAKSIIQRNCGGEPWTQGSESPVAMLAMDIRNNAIGLARFIKDCNTREVQDYYEAMRSVIVAMRRNDDAV
jgi:hypothetical protein